MKHSPGNYKFVNKPEANEKVAAWGISWTYDYLKYKELIGYFNASAQVSAPRPPMCPNLDFDGGGCGYYVEKKP